MGNQAPNRPSSPGQKDADDCVGNSLFGKTIRRAGGKENFSFSEWDGLTDNDQETTKLHSLVLKWTVEDILNEGLLVSKVKHIPTTFLSLDDYLNHYKWPLVEEVRGQLQQSLESIGDSPYLPVKVIEEDMKNARSSGQANEFKSLFIFIESNCAIDRHKGIDPKKSDLKLIPKDLVLLTTIVPDNLQDLRRRGSLQLLALIDRIGGEEDEEEGDGDTPQLQRLKAKIHLDNESFEEVRSKDRIRFVFKVINLATSTRIWNALQPHGVKRVASPIIQEILYTNSDVATKKSSYLPMDGKNADVISKFCEFCRLNDSQTAAVAGLVSALQNKEAPFVRMIQGPPGTGKTTTIVSLLSVISCLNMKCLVTAPTNVAVSGLALKYIELFMGSSRLRQFSEFCEGGESASHLCKSLHQSDIVLVGNEDKLPLEGPLQQIFLKYRVRRLINALYPHTGWRSAVNSMLEFLESAKSQHKMANEVAEQNKDREINEAHKEKYVSFLQYVKCRFPKLATELLSQCDILVTDLPSNLMDKDMLASTSKFLDLMVEFLMDSSIPDEKFPYWFSDFSEEMDLKHFSRSILSNSFQKEDFRSLRKYFAATKNSLAHHLRKLLENSKMLPISVPSKEQIESLCMENCCLLFCTVSIAGRPCVKDACPFNCVIIDEAAQLVEAETAIVTQMPGLTHAILVGDHQQLPATVISKVAAESGYGRSLFERLQILGHHYNILDTQYRMHPFISLFPNIQFYDGLIKDGENVKTKVYNMPYQTQLYGPYAFIDVPDGQEDRDPFGKSKRNSIEAAIIVHVIQKLTKACAQNSICNPSLGVITPYSSQVQLLTRSIEEIKKDKLDIEINSVDGFQGQEKDIIIFSTVRANQNGEIGFLEDYRRLNVAVTRSRYSCWIFGNSKTLTARNRIWSNLIKDAVKRGLYFDTGSDKKMRRLIKEKKAEINQLTDLLRSDSTLFKESIWKVLFSKEFKNSITKIKSIQTKFNIINSIVILSNGHFPRKNMQRVKVENNSDLIQVKQTSGFYLVWSIDVERHTMAKQIIKIWDVVDLACVPHLVKRLEAAFISYSPEYIKRCKAKVLSRDGKFVAPATWKADPTFLWLKSHKKISRGQDLDESQCGGSELEVLEKSTVDESILLMKFYCLSSAIASQLLTAIDGSEIDLPFEVNEQQNILIQYPWSSFILGRSGTGKTTVLVLKLLRQENNFWLSQHGFKDTNDKGEGGHELGNNIKDGSHLHQLLVTLSPKLCHAIRNQIVRLQRSLCWRGGNTNSFSHSASDELILDFEEEDKAMGFVPDSFISVSEKFFPMVITFRKFLMMLDKSVPFPFFHENLQQRTMQELDKDPNTSEPCSTKSQHHTDEKQLSDKCTMISYANTDMVSKKNSSIQKIGKREVNFEIFDSSYWPHLNSELTKRFDSSLIFVEIMSDIKGSIESVKSPKGIISRECYLSRNDAKSSSFDLKQRDAIYSLFLQYEKLKMTRNEYDTADQVAHLYRQLSSGCYLGENMQFIYIDEVQDLTQAQIALFSFMSMNSKEGFSFAGDTAQTIAKGVNFRFQDLRSLFYTDFLKQPTEKRRNKYVSSSVTTSSCTMEEITKNNKHIQESKEKVQDFFQLTDNFRTHMGIVNVANGILRLIHYFFPHAIDKLEPETSIIHGELPLFLDADKNFVKLFFGGNESGKGNACEFGAEQAILVRDDQKKQQLVNQIGRKGLVLTINCSKGLEFQDVLLYNFFSDSPLKHKWRVIYQYMFEIGNMNCGLKKDQAYPCFNINKFNLLCSELKHLYVAVTRARQRLWIYDDNSLFYKPMLDYWLQSEHIKVKFLDESFISSMQATSTAEDWRRRGIQMFNDLQYDMAILSFERAGDKVYALLAKAASLQQSGERQLGKNSQAAVAQLKEAGNIFLSLGKAESAAKCFVKIEDFNQAGNIYFEKCNPPKFEEAGDCYLEAKQLIKAADSFSKAHCYKKCLDVCWQTKLLEEGLCFIDEWLQTETDDRICQGKCTRLLNGEASSRLPFSQLNKNEDLKHEEFEKVINDYLRDCAIYQHQQKNIALMMKFVKRFSNVALKRAFLKARDYLNELLEIEEAEGCFIQAAELAERKGDLLHTAELLEKSGDHEYAIRKILSLVRHELIWGEGNIGWPLKQSTNSLPLIGKVKALLELSAGKLCQETQLEIQILLGEVTNIEELKNMVEEAEKMDNLRLKVFAARKAIDTCTDILGVSYQGGKGSDLEKDFQVLDVFPYSKLQNLNEISRAMIQCWKNWEEIIQLLKKDLHQLRQQKGRFLEQPLLGFCYEYFSVYKSENHRFVIVRDPKATWLNANEINVVSFQGQKPQISIEKFATLSQQFWTEQVSATCHQVVKAIKTHVWNQLDFLRRCVPQFSLTAKQHHFTAEKGTSLLELFEIVEKAISSVQGLDELWKAKRDLQKQLFSMIFPHVRQAEDMYYVYNLRKDPRSVAIFENITDELIEKAKTNITLEEIGRLQCMIFLQKKSRISGHSHIITLNEKENCWTEIFFWESETSEDDAALSFKSILKFGDILVKIFNLDWKRVKGYINPFVFVTLLERAAVMASACVTLLHGMILPQTVSIDLMTGQQDQLFYSRLLCTQQSTYYQNLQKVLWQVTDMCLQLLTDMKETENWIESANLDWRTYLPKMVLRLLILLLIVCLNSKHSGIQEKVVSGLKCIFGGSSPVLVDLPFQFKSKLVETFTKQQGRLANQHGTIKKSFADAMLSIGDTLIMTKRCPDLTCCPNESGIRSIEVDSFVGCEPDTLMPRDLMHVDFLNSHPLTEENLEEGTESCSPAPPVPNQNDNEAECKKHVDTESCTVPWFVGWRLKHLLKRARKKLEEQQCTPIGYYRQEANCYLQKNDEEGKSYLGVFICEACPLKVEVNEYLQNLSIAMMKLKSTSNSLEREKLLDELNNAEENLKKALQQLDPRHEKHQEHDLVWMKQVIESLQKEYIEVENKFHGKLKSLFRDLTPGEGDNKKDDEVTEDTEIKQNPLNHQQNPTTKQTKSKHKKKQKHKHRSKH